MKRYASIVGDYLEPSALRDSLMDVFMRYYDTAYDLKSDEIASERRYLLQRGHSVFADPYLELQPRYESSQFNFVDLFQDLGQSDFSGFVEAGLFSNSVKRPYFHQEIALRESLDGKNVLVSTGTGSGKTESFLLPIFFRLAQESKKWGASKDPSVRPWWQTSECEYVPSRINAESRPAAMRSLILYPMNALVEDQLTRLRRSIDSSPARRWFDQYRNGNTFFYGRYTGRSPGTGDPSKTPKGKRKEIASLLLDQHRAYQSIKRRVQKSPEEDLDLEFYLPNPLSSEMTVRWDMQVSPPDILITNYSMLAIMLMRKVEDNIFHLTRKWLEASEQNVFTLVIDELHMYRGTQGTEVSYLLRRLMSRLGLDDRPNQLNVIATTASLPEDSQNHEFLQQFFASDRSFKFVNSVYSFSNLATPEESRLVDKFLANELKPQSLEDLAKDSLLEGADPETQLNDLIRSQLDKDPSDRLRFRTHLFFRTIPGIWACSDPQCEALPSQYRSESRNIGRLYSRPRFTCDCGSRVLECLYCEGCGEIFLGGYKKQSNDGKSEFLLPEVANFESLPESSSFQKNAQNYALYWPNLNRTPHKLDWEAKSSIVDDLKFEFRFVRCKFFPVSGEIRNIIDVRHQRQANGWTFKVEAKRGRMNSPEDLTSVPALPVRCPACGKSAERRRNKAGVLLSPESPERTRSFIKSQGIGFDRAGQAISSALNRELGSKLIVFSDSRQGAAKVAANLELSHYQDLVRFALVRELKSHSFDARKILELVQKRSQGESLTDVELKVFSDFQNRDPELIGVLLAGVLDMNMLSAQQKDRFEGIERGLESAGSSFQAILRATFNFLIERGVNPAGMRDLSFERPWHELFSWAPHVRVNDFLMPNDQIALTEIERGCLDQIGRTIFASAGRDLESLGLGIVKHRLQKKVSRDLGLSEEVFDQILTSVIRIMGQSRRVDVFLDKSDFFADDWPSRVKGFLKAVANRHSVSDDDLKSVIKIVLLEGNHDFTIWADKLQVVPPNSHGWICSNCRTIHLQESAGICITCNLPLGNPEPIYPYEDYYAWLTDLGEDSVGRLHCEELSGQTAFKDAQERQARFQDIFIDKAEKSLPLGIDILSVTTTMEAGVDIGALKGVILANVPPMRFNYQQRVGRAGRRNDVMSVALTICRGGRSHDEFYFNNIHRITGDPPPRPFIDLRSKSIFLRSLNSQVLAQAFRDIVPIHGNDSGTVHGEFGPVSEYLAINFGNPTPILQDVIRSQWETLEASTLFVLESSQVSMSIDEIRQYLLDELPDLVTQAAASQPKYSDDLATTLAYAGLLPMYGMPTQSRSLFYARSSERTIDRNAFLAISEYSPGAQIIHDKKIHTVIGVVDYERRGQQSVPRANPLGNLQQLSVIGLCDSCLTVDRLSQLGNQVKGRCPRCGQGENYRITNIAFPEGYRTDFKPRPYEQIDQTVARGQQPRVALETEIGHKDNFDEFNLFARAANADLLAINDNNGDGFTFGEIRVNDKLWDGLIADPRFLVDQKNWLVGKEHDLSRYWKALPQEGTKFALAARRRTDILVLELLDSLNFNMSPKFEKVRGYWASLGYILKGAISSTLQIDHRDLEVGVQSSRNDGKAASLFIADTLENGSGYATWAYENIETFLPSVFEEYSLLLSEHSGEEETCDSSCYECLRDFYNMRWHPLLDWRSGLDLLNMMLGKSVAITQHNSQILKLLEGLSRELRSASIEVEIEERAGVPLLIKRATKQAISILHDFEELGNCQRSAVIAQDFSDLRDFDRFTLIRKPWEILAHFSSRQSL